MLAARDDPTLTPVVMSCNAMGAASVLGVPRSLTWVGSDVVPGRLAHALASQ